MAEDDEANEGPGVWESVGVTGDKLEDDESLLSLVQRSLLLLEGSYDSLETFAEVLRGGKREVTGEAKGQHERLKDLRVGDKRLTDCSNVKSGTGWNWECWNGRQELWVGGGVDDRRM